MLLWAYLASSKTDHRILLNRLEQRSILPNVGQIIGYCCIDWKKEKYPLAVAHQFTGYKNVKTG